MPPSSPPFETALTIVSGPSRQAWTWWLALCALCLCALCLAGVLLTPLSGPPGWVAALAALGMLLRLRPQVPPTVVLLRDGARLPGITGATNWQLHRATVYPGMVLLRLRSETAGTRLLRLEADAVAAQSWHQLVRELAQF